jgi:acetyl esterase/lipase
MNCTRETGGGAPTRGQKILAATLRGSLSVLLKPAFLSRSPVALQRHWLAALSRTTLPARGVPRRRTVLGPVPVELTGNGHSGTVLYLHGGGYVSGAPVTHRALTSHLAKLADASVAVADYRLAPEHPFPAALDDAHRAYLALLEKGHAPERLAVAGDSAGGGLTLALLQRLRDEGQPLPACALMFSPWVDLTLAETPRTVPGEAMLNRQWLTFAAEAYAGNQRDSAGASPLLGNLDGLPPLLIQTGSDEILANDSERLAEALDGADCDARYQRYPGRWHVFQLHAGMLHDADLALAECRDFLHRHWR